MEVDRGNSDSLQLCGPFFCAGIDLGTEYAAVRLSISEELQLFDCRTKKAATAIAGIEHSAHLTAQSPSNHYLSQ